MHKLTLSVVVLAMGLGGCVTKIQTPLPAEVTGPPATTPTTIPTVMVTIEPGKPVGDAIKEQIVNKYKKNAQEVTVTVSETITDYAKGLVNFTGEGGGMWFAHKEKGEWRLVFDGQTAMPCADANSNGFPKTMVPECLSGNRFIKR